MQTTCWSFSLVYPLGNRRWYYYYYYYSAHFEFLPPPPPTPSRGIKPTFPGFDYVGNSRSDRESRIEFILEKHSSNSCRSNLVSRFIATVKTTGKFSSCEERRGGRRWSGLATGCLELWLKYVYSGTTLSTIEREQEALALILNCLSWPVTFLLLLPLDRIWPAILRTGWIKYDQE